MSEFCDKTIKLNVMIVDDDKDQRWLTYDALMQMECSCLINQASTAEEALEILTRQEEACNQAERPDILFLDIEMPGMGGMALLSRIKTDPKLRDIEVIVVSDSGDVASRKLEAFRRGADDFIRKSKDILGMMEKLQNSVRHRVKLKQVGNNCGDNEK